jgi:hypothetical protein
LTALIDFVIKTPAEKKLSGRRYLVGFQPERQNGKHMKLFTPTTLKISAIGLKNLLNVDWMEGNFYFIAEEAYQKNDTIFHISLKKGFLFCLGEFFYSDYLKPHNVILGFPENNKELYFELYTGISQLLEFLRYHKLNVRAKDNEISIYIEKLLVEYEESEISRIGSKEYIDYLTNTWNMLLNENANELEKLKPLYAANYAERVFHDRELCEYISTNFQQSGFGWGEYNIASSEIPKQWVERIKWPRWVERAVIARDRGDCAICGKHLVDQAEENNIDHIVALSIGGTNDLVNLQLTCPVCNKKKSSKLQAVNSSIPSYLGRIVSRTAYNH